MVCFIIFYGFSEVKFRKKFRTTLQRVRHEAAATSWLESERFTDLERRIVYWVQPSLDPRFAAAIKASPEFAMKLRDAGTDRTSDEATLLTELNISWETAYRASVRIFNELVVMQGWRAFLNRGQ